jgi:hypothetical protein
MPTTDEYMKIIQAMKFYNAKTDGQLILALLEHVERLQEKLPPMKDTQERKVREG